MDLQLGAWQSEGQGFESPRVHQIFEIRIDPWHLRAPNWLGSCCLFCCLSAAYRLPVMGRAAPHTKRIEFHPAHRSQATASRGWAINLVTQPHDWIYTSSRDMTRLSGSLAIG